MKEVRLDLLNIPEEPKISLENYLLNLVDKNDGPSTSLYLWNVEIFIQEIWREIIQQNKIINVRQIIPQKLGIRSVSHFYGMKNGKTSISIQHLYKLLQLWKNYCNKTDEEIKQKWNDIFQSDFSIVAFSKNIRTKFPKFITPKLSYLLGWLIGDGNLDLHKNKCQIRFYESDKSILDENIGRIIKGIFDIKNLSLMKHRTENCYILSISSKSIFRFFKNVLKIKVGQIPEIINSFDNTNKILFIRGIFDAEGDVSQIYSRSRWAVRISQNNFKFLENLQKILNALGINSKGPYRFSNAFSLAIYRKSEILKFRDIIGSSYPKKMERLQYLTESFLNKYKISHISRINTK